MKEKDRVFLLDAPLSPSGLFGDAVNAVVDRYQEARKQAAAFQRFLPRRRPTHEAAELEQPRPRTSSSHRETQKQSVATRTPPHRGRVRRRSRSGAPGRSPICGSCFSLGGPRPSGPDGAGPLRVAPSGEFRGAPHYSVSGSPLCPREAVLPTLPVIQGAAASCELSPQSLPARDVPELGGSPPPAGVSGSARSGASCRATVTGHRSSDPCNTRGQSREAGSLSRSFGSVETTAQCVCLGPAHCRARLSHSVRRFTSAVQRGLSHFGGSRAGSGNGARSSYSPEEGGHRGGPSSVQRVRVLQPVLHCSQEGWGPASHFRSPPPEPLSHAAEVQDADCKTGRVTNQVRGLVCHDRSKGRVFPRLHPSSTQEVPEVCFQGRSLPISGSSFRSSTLPPHFHEVCGCSSGSPATPGHPHTQLHRRLAYPGPVGDGSGSASRCRSRTHERAGVKTKRQEKCAFSSTENHLSGRGVGFDHDAGTVVSCSDRVDPRRSHESEGRPVTHCQAVSTTAGSHGSCVQRDTFWPAVHETPTVVAQDQGVSPRGNPLRMIKVTRRCLRALDMWRKPWFLSQGPVLGAPCRRVTLATDASLTGWGAVMSGHPARGLWSGRHLSWHINCLEMLAVFQGLKHFLPDLRDRHVLVRTDNTAVVSYINHQGGLRSRPLYKLAHQILVWSQGKLLSLRAVFVPGYLNVGADVLSRQGPRPGEWMLHPEVVKQIWRVFGPAQVDLFATRDNAQCPLWYSLVHPAPLGLDAMVQTWPRLRLYAFPPIALLPGVLERVRRDGVSLLLVAPFWPGRVWFSDLISLLDGSPWEIPVRRDLLSQAGGSFLHPRPELWKLWVWPLRGRTS
ncbi:ORF V: Enzymatic polyprotein [Labeo rohita]|uniref:ORF V: Enzymatic polyprotein n=1 Tax=Labeo rohita TaxID=84645 RepID=A0ABQ8M7W1_LABRO|nr:ORF V: Enzymatic polyprotein [Labeo rohita]